jgi:hypothetical protein
VTAEVMARAGKVRLVIGLFDTAEELGSGLVELRSRGLKPAQINLIAQADALQGSLSGWSRSEAERCFSSWIVCWPVDGADHWTVAAVWPRAAVAATAEYDARALLELRHWALRRQAQQMRRHLQEGGALVLVEPDDDAEERAACTALLRYASGGVQTHEITRLRER